MGILPELLTAMAALPLPTGFSVCELGDQRLDKDTPARPWYEARGCRRYVAIDANGRGTLTKDLNWPTLIREKFDLVTDFGTGEHIFDQEQVWRTLHELCQPGGFIVFDRPAQGYEKHCFYLINECLVRDLAAANGYTVRWLTHAPRTRGLLIRGVLQTPARFAPFRNPQQGKYAKDLVIPT